MKKLAIIALAAVAVGAQAVVLDDFSDGANGFSITTGTSGSVTPATVPGASRFLFGQVGSNSFSQFLDMNVTSGALVVSNGFGVVSSTVVGYGVSSFSPPSTVTFFDMNLNLSGMGDRFRFNFLGNDLPLGFQVLVANNLGSISSFASVNMAANPSPHSQDVLFSSFTGGANFSSADQILIAFNTNELANVDFALDSIEVVPEPASMAALGLGAIALMRRRRANKAS